MLIESRRRLGSSTQHLLNGLLIARAKNSEWKRICSCRVLVCAAEDSPQHFHTKTFISPFDRVLVVVVRARSGQEPNAKQKILIVLPSSLTPFGFYETFRQNSKEKNLRQQRQRRRNLNKAVCAVQTSTSLTNLFSSFFSLPFFWLSFFLLK